MSIKSLYLKKNFLFSRVSCICLLVFNLLTTHVSKNDKVCCNCCIMSCNRLFPSLVIIPSCFGASLYSRNEPPTITLILHHYMQLLFKDVNFQLEQNDSAILKYGQLVYTYESITVPIIISTSSDTYTSVHINNQKCSTFHLETVIWFLFYHLILITNKYISIH